MNLRGRGLVLVIEHFGLQLRHVIYGQIPECRVVDRIIPMGDQITESDDFSVFRNALTQFYFVESF